MLGGGGGTGLYFLLSGHLLSGHGDTITANPFGKAGPTSGGGSNKTNLADLATIDPCGFFTVSSFAAKAMRAPKTNQPVVTIQPNSFTDCEIGINLANPANQNDVAYISIDTELIPMLQGEIASDGLEISTEGEFTLYRPTNRNPSDQKCSEGIEMPGEYGLYITAEPADGNTHNVASCDLADIASNDAVAAVSQGIRRVPSYPSNSAGSLDACSLVDAATASQATGQSGLIAFPGLGNHECGYDEGGNVTAAHTSVWVYTSLYFGSPKDLGGASVTESSVAGRDTFSQPGDPGQPGQCMVMTAVHGWKPWPGSIALFQWEPTDPGPNSTLIEYETIFVEADGTMDQNCQMARQLAMTVWPRLPATS